MLFSPWHLLLALLLMVVARYYKAWVGSVRVYRRRLRLCAEIFGLPFLPIIGNFHQLPHSPLGFGDFMIREANRAAAASEGLFRILSFNFLVVTPVNGDALRPLLESTAELHKGADYDFYRQWLGDGLLLVSDSQRWHVQRKLLTPVFHFSRLATYMTAFNRRARTLVKKLEEEEKKGDKEECSARSGRNGEWGGIATTDIYPLLSHCTLDIIGETMGVPLESQAGGSVEYVDAVKDFNYYAYVISTWPQYWIPWVWRWFGYGRQTDKVVDVLRSTSKRAISNARKAALAGIETSVSTEVLPPKKLSTSSTKPLTLIEMLLAMEGGKDGEEDDGLLPEDIQAQVDTFMFAGHDTTAHALAWTLWCLACHPEIQERAYHEVVAACGEEGGEIVMEQFAHLKYLERCVKEAMRYFPPVPVAERTLKNDLVMAGKLVPAGTLILISPYAVHHNEQIYPHHERYDPDRFLEEVSAQRHPYDYIPFSAGPRNCIGQKFAWMEMRIILAHILRRFRLATDLPFEANRPSLETILKPSLGIPVHIHDRKLCEN